MTLKNPREENGPDGYPLDNKAFQKASQKVLQDRRDDAAKAEAFLDRLAKDSSVASAPPPKRKR